MIKQLGNIGHGLFYGKMIKESFFTWENEKC